MVNLVLKTISRTYNEKLESAFTRILYFFNTIDTYFLLSGTAALIIAFPQKINLVVLTLSLLFAIATAKIADFYPSFVILATPVLVMVGFALNLPASLVSKILLVNVEIFFIIQFLFMGLPDSIVSRDIRVAFIKMFNSLFTVAPTTVSFSMSVFFSFYASFCMLAAISSRTKENYSWLVAGGVILLICAWLARFMRPQNHFSKFHKPDVLSKPLFKRVVILNIDGVRKDVFDSLDLPARDRLIKEGASHSTGLETVYRALTNPAFASIFTGTIPKVHGVINNNFNQYIKTEGLPDVVPTISYGSMHVKHFCKRSWETRIVSLPRHSIYHCDDIMIDWLKQDILSRAEVRLFVADFSEADFLAHAYGSKSKQYKDALKRIDKRIGDFLDWLEKNGILNDTVIIVCSDHGIAAIDHSYLIADSEKYVPFFIYGKGIKKGFQISRPGKIMDICCTISYFLGVRYPCDARGQVFTEAIEGFDLDSQKDAFVSRFNQLKYDAEANVYHTNHVEIYEGDINWWDRCISKFVMNGKPNLRVLDIGCGDGFVGKRFAAKGINFKEFVCMDISNNLLEEAKKNLAGLPCFSFTNNLDNINGAFDIITVSSLFHHMANPAKIANRIGTMLNEGGVIIGSHEPNQKVFKNKFFLFAATFYKRMGGGISIDDNITQEFNRLLQERYRGAPAVCREEILQMVEYHSPIEQYDYAIDADKGFIPNEFFKTYFPAYKIMELETYTTFYHRPWLAKHQAIQQILKYMFHLFFQEGNLFRFVLRKD